MTDSITESHARAVYQGRDILGESPLWHADDNAVYWLDIKAARLHRFSEQGGSVVTTAVPSESTSVVNAEAGRLALAAADGLYEIRDRAMEKILDSWISADIERTNDGAVDAMGRFWIGCMGRDRAAGSGYIGQIADGEWRQEVTGMTLPNGIGWNYQGDLMFYVDTGIGTIWKAPYDQDSGRLSAESVPFVRLDTREALIDGIALDQDGCVWAGMWGAGAVFRFNSEGRLIEKVIVPTRNVTSCAFGGESLTTLYITTARDPDVDDSPAAGSLYAAEVQTPGVPTGLFRPEARFRA